MQIIRDEEIGGIMMIPLLSQYQINRCNIKNCKEKPTTICIHEQADFGNDFHINQNRLFRVCR